jgi:YbbR domain-containing protein
MNRFKDLLLVLASFRWLSAPLRLFRRNARAFLASHLLLKMMSLVLGVLLWYAISATDLARPTRFVQVRPAFAGEVAGGYELAQPAEVDKKEVVVWGRRSVADRLSRIDYLQTKPVPVHGFAATDEWKTIEVDTVNVPGIEWPFPPGALSCDPVTVRVRVLVRSLLKEHVLRSVPVQILAVPGPAVQATVEPATVDVCVLAPQSLLLRLDKKALRVYVDLGSVASDATRQVVPEVVLPEGVRLAKSLPPVTVKPLGPPPR